MTPVSSGGDEDDATGAVRLIPIAHGDFGPTPNPGRQLSWSDFNALAQQTNAMRERLEILERQRQQPRDSGEASPFLGPSTDEGEKHGSPDDSPDEGPGATLTESAIDREEDKNYELPESTYTFLTTEKILSAPFATGIIALVMAVMCLLLAFLNEFDKGTEGNRLGLPAGVKPEVRVAQYLGLMIGVLMENEIPTGLELIGKSAEQKKTGDERFSTARIVLPAILRMVVGYMFLLCLFLVVVQEATVLDIFFDILALEFVENIDDVIYELSKRGFFGHQLRVSSNTEHYIVSTSESHIRRRRTKRFIRCVYVLNMCASLGGLTYFALRQEEGDFRCNSVTLTLGDDVWEDAWVIKGNVDDPGYDDIENRLLVFAHFNGVYIEDGSKNGRPRYVEQNKEDGAPFKRTEPAELVYCDDIESWVLRHDRIRTSNPGTKTEEGVDENECHWLIRSPETESYDVVELAEETEWFVWKGLVESEYRISIECNECSDSGDCNYNGECVNDKGSSKIVRRTKCQCSEEHFGTFCQYDRPCDVIRSEKDSSATLKILPDPGDSNVDFVEVYGRPMYVAENLSGKPLSFLRLGYPEVEDQYYSVEYPPNSTGTDGVGDLAPHKHYSPGFFEDDDFFEVNNATTGFQELLKNYTFVLRYTGRRWYGQIVPPGLTGQNFEEEEYHAFWNSAFSGLGDEDNSTVIISAPTFGKGSPVGVDFYEMRRRNVAFESGVHDYDYSPFGVLIPLVEYDGSGFFHCNKA